MTDEIKLTQDASRGVRAQRLLNDELLTEAFTSLEQSYIEAWRSTTIHDTAAREKLFLAINVLGKVREQIASVVNNGKIADAELKRLSEVTERRKRFGIV